MPLAGTVAVVFSARTILGSSATNASATTTTFDMTVSNMMRSPRFKKVVKAVKRFSLTRIGPRSLSRARLARLRRNRERKLTFAIDCVDLLAVVISTLLVQGGHN